MDTYTEVVTNLVEMLPRLVSQPYDTDLRLREHTLMVSTCEMDEKYKMSGSSYIL